MPVLKDETLMVPKVAFYNLKKDAMLAKDPARKMLNGLIRMVFTQQELSSSKATDARNTGVPPLDQEKCGTICGKYQLHFCNPLKEGVKVYSDLWNN